MKKLIAIATLLTALLPLGMASATTNHPFYCGTSAYDHTYAAIYQFPTGTYWQAEIAAGYYKATNTKLLAQYGC